MANLQSFERTDIPKVKAELHRKVLDRLDLEKLSRVNSTQARQAVAGLVNEIVTERAPKSRTANGPPIGLITRLRPDARPPHRRA